MPFGRGKKLEQSSSKMGNQKVSKSGLSSKSEEHVKILKSVDSVQKGPEQVTARKRSANNQQRIMERVEMLARPTPRRLQSLWDEKGCLLPPERRDKIKSALEEDYFLSPEQTEQYFQAMINSRQWSSPGNLSGMDRKEQADKSKELRQRQKWLVNFSAQVAYRLCDYIAKGNKEMMVSNRLRSIADVVLERVADILGEPKPSRNHTGRLARFMVAISDRIAVWIENAVYRADAYEPSERGSHEHMRLDAEKPLVFFLLVCVALAAAAPQYIAGWPGYYGNGYYGGIPNTLVAGPTVVNGLGGRIIAPGYVGPALY